MAILNPNSSSGTISGLASNKLWPNVDTPHNITGNFAIPIIDHQIQGQMITATLEIDEMQQMVLDDVAMKNKVLNALVNELLSAKCIEFTKQQDVASNTIKVRARIYATPDSQVRIIRSATK